MLKDYENLPKSGDTFKVSSGETVYTVDQIQGNLYNVWWETYETGKEYEFSTILNNIKEGVWDIVKEDKPIPNAYYLKDVDIENGYVILDPALIAKTWRVGSKDDSCCLNNILNIMLDFNEESSKIEDIKNINLQIQRLAELEGVELNE